MLNTMRIPKRFLRFYFARHLLALFCLGLLSVATAHASEPEVLARKGIDQILNLEMDGARRTFAELHTQYPQYPLFPFLDASVYWAEAEVAQRNRDQLRELAIQQMLQAMTTANEQLAQDPQSAPWKLTRGMASFFAARMYADKGRSISAYKFGRSGRDDLREVVAVNPEMNDAYLVLGMYEYIAGSIPRGLRWLAALFDLKGDRDLGVRYLERATSKARVMAPEAARMLLVAAGVQPETTRTCAYLELAKYMRKAYPRNPHYSVALQLIYVNCGYPQLALAETDVAEKEFLEQFPNLKEEFEAIRLYAYRDLGKLSTVLSMKQKFEHDEAYWKIILAQTYDVLGQRKKAVALYDEIYWADLEGKTIETDSGPPADWIIDRATRYRKQPYQPGSLAKSNNGEPLQLNNQGQ